ncbi:hypothetical protein LA080_011809 [Diaporthe eres]|uniref:Uncharacterized protein n=1 Tax=Diaporthe vaccinii TaxID=105482 RepID=A0ABR4DV09_9PEZI|nr:hypothetical protein LA080_011809 [Diaporthe eres]
MSPEDLGYQLNAAFLDKLVNHTLTQLDQVVRDRENQTPEVEFDEEYPAHSFKFECKQISAWFQNEEIDTLRKTIQDIHYWTEEAHVLVGLIIQELHLGLTYPFESIFGRIKLISNELAKDELDGMYESMARLSQCAEGVVEQLRANIENKWASENARTASQWQENTGFLRRIAEDMGMPSKRIQKARQDITDEQYWRCEVEALKPHRYQHEYNQQQSTKRQSRHLLPKPTLSAQSTRVLRAHTHPSPRNLSQRKQQGGKVARGCSSTLKPRPEPSERRRSARLKQLAERRAQGEEGLSR